MADIGVLGTGSVCQKPRWEKLNRQSGTNTKRTYGWILSYPELAKYTKTNIRDANNTKTKHQN